MLVEQRLKQVGEKLKALRESSGYTVEALSELCGLSTQTIHRIEQGNNASMNSFIKIVRCYKITIEDFFSGMK